jgi:hypothetical protein
VVRFDDASRQSVETIASTLIDTPVGAKVPISQVAEVRVDQGPNTINRENVQRRIIVQANVANRDLGSVIDEIRTRIASEVPLPEGYFVQYGGQFEAQEAAARQISIMSVVAAGGIFLLLYLALGSGPIGATGDGEPATGAHWWGHHGFRFRWNALDRLADRIYHLVRHRNPQRNHVDHALSALDEGGRCSLPDGRKWRQRREDSQVSLILFQPKNGPRLLAAPCITSDFGYDHSGGRKCSG